MAITNPSRDAGNSVDEDLQAALLETERHVGAEGWGQSARPFALLRSAELLTALPDSSPVVEPLQSAVADSPGHLTPVELEARGTTAADVLDRVQWPGESVGAVLVVEHEAVGVPSEEAAPDAGAAELARLVVGVLWDGPGWCVVRLADGSLSGGEDLVADLVRQVRASGAELGA
jgi:hypothetical protein